MTLFSGLTLALSIVAAIYWFLIYRNLWVRHASWGFVLIALVNFLAESNLYLSLWIIFISMGVIIYWDKAGKTEEIVKENKGSQAINTGNGAVRGELGTFKFQYADADGNHTSRLVDVNRLYFLDNVGYFAGFCHQRGAERTFRMDRVYGQIVDVNTGEFLEL